MRFLPRLFLLLPLLAMPLLAQTPTGTVEGVVTDAGGAAIVGASVTIVETSTNETRTLTTDSAGRYEMPFVQPGTYSVKVVAPGFRAASQIGLHVEVATGSTADFKLVVGQASDQVQVTANVETLDTETSNLSDTIPTRLILDLPDNGRNPFDFALLAPTVSNLGNASTPHIGGSRNGNNEQLIDGMTNILPENNVGNNVSAYNPIVDSVQEVNVQTSVLAAEYGRFSGGIVSLVTKGGANAFHGSGFEFLEATGLNANAFGAAPGSAKTNSHRYQTGGTFSGPIHRDKTFFFVDFEDSRQSAGTSITSTVPQNLAAYLTGDFSKLGAPIYDPLTVHLGTYYDTSSKTTVTGYVRDQFQGNMIPPGRLSPIAQKILGYFPAPQTTAASNNYVNSGANTNNYYHFDTRLDQQWDTKWHSFLRFSHSAGNNAYLQDYAGSSTIASPGGYNGPTSGN
ncbi:MAG TPA: carboxypeptidase-like regulatory domain-containing protein, partial [Acidobacteriaceae bacterium]